MLLLPNGCTCSELSIFPKNWDKKGADLKKVWYIQYYFHDPEFKDKFPYGCLRMVKGGLNRLNTLEDRRKGIQMLRDELLNMLINEGYNPITKQSIAPVIADYEIDPNTLFIPALKKAAEKLKLVASTKSDMNSVIKGISTAANQLRYSTLPICQVRRKHIRSILEHIGTTNKKFSANRFNKYRSYLMMLFKELVELEATDTNPIREISKQKVVHKMRELLTPDQRIQVDKHLKENNYSFWRFLQIFFHSGARETELLRIQAKDVDLARQRYKLIVKKGRDSRETERTIKDIALPLWEELMKDCTSESFIFSEGLNPGLKQIRADQIPRRWRTWVKKPLGITADFYSLKHLNLDETAAMLDIQAAANMAGHTSTVITMAHYATGEKERIHQRLKTVANTF